MMPMVLPQAYFFNMVSLYAPSICLQEQNGFISFVVSLMFSCGQFLFPKPQHKTLKKSWNILVFVEIGRRRLAPVPSDQDWERLKDEEGRLNDALLDFRWAVVEVG